MWLRVFQANLAYAIGTALTSAGLFVLIPILTRHLTPSDYGTWAIYEITILFLSVAMIAGTDSGLMRHYDGLATDCERSQFAGALVCAVTLAGTAIVIVGCGLLLIGQRFGLPGSRDAIGLALGTAAAESIFTMILNIFRVRELPRTYVALSVARTVGFVGGSTMLLEQGHGLEGALAGRLIATFIVAIIAAGFASRHMVLRFRWSLVRPALTYGIALVPTSGALYVLFGADRYFIQHLMTLSDVAVYSFAYKMAAIADIVVTRPFATDWAARRFKIATLPDARERYGQVFAVYLGLIGACSLGVLAITPLFFRWFAPGVYGTGMKLVPVILLAYVIVGLSNPANVGVMIKDRTVWMPIIGLIAAGIYVAALTIVVPMFGLMGAAWATVGAYTVWTAGIWFVSQRLYSVSYNVRTLSWITGAGGTAYAGMEAIGHSMAGSLYAEATLKLTWILGVGVVAFAIQRRVRVRGNAVREAVTI